MDLLGPGGDTVHQRDTNEDGIPDIDTARIGVVSTVHPGWPYPNPEPSLPGRGYYEGCGTSQATAYVTGAASLLRDCAAARWQESNLHLENCDVENILKYTAHPMPITYGNPPQRSIGYGRLDIYEALRWVESAIDNDDWEKGYTPGGEPDADIEAPESENIYFIDCRTGPIWWREFPDGEYEVTRHRIEREIEFDSHDGRIPKVWNRMPRGHTGYSPGEGPWRDGEMRRDYVFGIPWAGVVENDEHPVTDHSARLFTYVYEISEEYLPPPPQNCEDCEDYCGLWVVWTPLDPPLPDCPYRCCDYDGVDSICYCCYPNPVLHDLIDPVTNSIWIPCPPSAATMAYTVFWPPSGSSSSPEGIGESPKGAYSFALHPAAPNPFSNTTTLSYSFPHSSHTSLKIYDVSGRFVKTLVDGSQDLGIYKLKWDGRDNKGESVSSGVYFATLMTEKHQATCKLILRR